MQLLLRLDCGIMAEMNLAAGIEHVTDKKEVGRYGLMGTPALIINGKVMSVGTVPPKSKIKARLGEFAQSQTHEGDKDGN